MFWNHQGWKGQEKGAWLEVHTTLYDNKWLHGMEVCNGDDYYPEAHQWCLDKNLTMLGTSDIHPPDLRLQSEPKDHRTLTLAFVKERSLEGLKEALQNGRTAVWCKGQVIGRREWLEPLFDQCVRVSRPHLRSKNALWVEVRNACSVDIRLERAGDVGPAELTLPAAAVSLVKVEAKAPAEAISLSYTAPDF